MVSFDFGHGNQEGGLQHCPREPGHSIPTEVARSIVAHFDRSRVRSMKRKKLRAHYFTDCFTIFIAIWRRR